MDNDTNGYLTNRTVWFPIMEKKEGTCLKRPNGGQTVFASNARAPDAAAFRLAMLYDRRRQ